MSATTLQWIESNGGPLLLLGEESLAEWEGADGPANGPTDFERACSVRGPIERLRVGRGVGLVLGDEPLSTAWMADAGGTGGVIVRLVRAADQAAVERVVRQAPKPGTGAGSGLVFSVTAPLVLFDAAHSGRDLPPMALRLELEPGQYEVDTLSFQPDPETALLLHRLSPT